MVIKDYFYETLNASEKKLYDALVNAAAKRGAAIPAGGTADNRISDIFSYCMCNHPQYFWVSPELGITKSLLAKNIVLKYAIPKPKEDQYQRQIDEVTKAFIAENINDHQSDYDRVLVIHDFLKRTVSYDHDSASFSPRAIAAGKTNAHNMVGALVEKTCVCEGFAKAMKYLCDQVGVECCVVTGTGSSSFERGPHAWNMVNINGCWQHVDVTWDNQFADDASIQNYAYMNLDDDTISRDHTWNRKHYPKCTEDSYNYFKMNNSVISSGIQLRRFLEENLAAEENDILFRVERDCQFAQEIMGVLDDTVRKAAANVRHCRMTGYSINCIESQLVYMIRVIYR